MIVDFGRGQGPQKIEKKRSADFFNLVTGCGGWIISRGWQYSKNE